MQLVVSPSALSFGNISLGSSSTQTVTLTNSGTASVTVSQASVSGAGFSKNGLTPPLTLPRAKAARSPFGSRLKPLERHGQPVGGQQ